MYDQLTLISSKLNPGRQNDVQEFISNLLTKINEIQDVRGIAIHIFGLEMSSQVECSKCHQKLIRNEPFMLSCGRRFFYI